MVRYSWTKSSGVRRPWSSSRGLPTATFAGHQLAVKALALCMILGAFPIPLVAQTLHTLGDIETSEKLELIASENEWHFGTPATTAKVSKSQIVRWGAWSGVLQDQAVWLSDDSFLCGEVRIGANDVTLSHDWLDIPPLAWNTIRGLVLSPPQTLNNWLELYSQMQAASGEEDVLWLVDGKRISGIVRMSDAGDPSVERTLSIDAAGQTITLRIDEIQAVAFSPALVGPMANHLGAMQVSLQDGSRLWTTRVVPTSANVQISLENGLTLKSLDASDVFVGAISGLAQPTATTQFLGDLVPASYRHLTDSTLPWELGVDRDSRGDLLHTERAIFPRGLATHSSSQVAYRWDGSAVRFLAEVTLAAPCPGAAEQWGSVECQVLVARGGALEKVHSFPLRRAAPGSKPAVEFIKLDLQDAKLIVLVTDKADFGQYGDHVLWLDARLLGK